MWVLNQLELTDPQPDLSARALAGELDRLYAHVAHRRVTVEDDATGRRLVDGMRERGYRPDRLAVMLLENPSPQPRPGIAREATGEPETFLAAELAVGLDTRDQPPDVVERLAGGRRRLRASRPGTRTFLGSREGVDACTVTLYTDGSTAQLEDVATLVEHRGRGLAAATLSLAIHEATTAGHDLVFLYVDADQGPVALYERLGFRTAGQYWTFTRPG